MSTTCVIFDAWHHPWVAVYKTWKERAKNRPLLTWLRWRIRRILNTGVHLRDLHTLDKLFGIHMFVYCLGEDRKVELVHRSTSVLSK